MKDIDKISEKVEKKKQHLQELFKKDKENYDLWAGKEQIFDTHKMAINITGTEMVALALRVQASLVRSRLDIHVLPPNPLPNPEAQKTADNEERMHYHGFKSADERLLAQGEATLLPSATWQTVVLGRTAVRILVYEDSDTGEIIWDYFPLNPMLLTFEFGKEGLLWACYETFRSSDCIYNEYKIEVKDDQGKGISVSDYWDGEHNVRFLTEDKTRLGKAWKHPFEEVPVIIQPVARVPKAIDVEGINVTSWGEGIFDHVKIPFRNLNKLRSIAATHAHLIAKAPIDHTYQAGTQPVVEEESFNFYAGAKLSHPDTEKLESMRIADIPPSLPTMMGDLSTGIQRATYTELSPDVAGHSGSALRILGQDKQDVETPRVETLNNLYTRICRMAKKQIQVQGLTIPVKTVVNKQYQVYDMKPEMFDNDFYINAELVRQDVYDDEAALQKAQLLRQNRWMSREDILERMLNEQDVPTQIAKMDIEEVEAAIPELKLKRVIKTYLDREMVEEAQMAMEQLAILLIQKQQALGQTMGQPTAGGAPTGAPPTQPPMTPPMPPQGAL